jgi:hypothetical protein
MLNGRAASRENSVMTSSGPPYKLKSVETVVRGSDVQARVFTLAPVRISPGTFTAKPLIITSCLKASSPSPLVDVM